MMILRPQSNSAGIEWYVRTKSAISVLLLLRKEYVDGGSDDNTPPIFIY